MTKLELTLKNYKNERIKKQSNQNSSMDLRDLKRDESAKKLSELEIQILSNRNDQGNQSGLAKNNSYLQLKNQALSVKKSSSKKENIVFNVQTDNYIQKNGITDKIQEVSCFELENKNGKSIHKKSSGTKQKQEILNSKENINITIKKQRDLISKQNSINQSKNGEIKENNNQNILKQKSISLYQQSNSQVLLSFSSFSNNKSQINNNYQETQQNDLLSQKIQQTNESQKQNQINIINQQKSKNNSFIDQQLTEENQYSSSQKQNQLQIVPTIQQLHTFTNHSSKNININSNKNINTSQKSQIQNIPPLFVNANMSKSQKKNSSLNNNYYYNEKYLSDSHHKREYNLIDRSTSQNSIGGKDEQNEKCSFQNNEVTPEPAQKNQNKLEQFKYSQNKIKNSDLSINQQKNNENLNIQSNKVSQQNNSNILHVNNQNSSTNKSQQKLSYNLSSLNREQQKYDLSKRNSYSLLRKSVNNQQNLYIPQESSISRQNSKSLYIPKSKTDIRSSETNQQLDNNDQYKEKRNDSYENYSQSQREQSNKENMRSQQNQLSKNNQSSLSELRLRRIRQCNASNSRNYIKLSNKSLQQNHSQQSTEDQEQTQSKKQSQKTNPSLNRIVDDKSGLIKEQTKKRIQYLIEQQNKKKLNQIVENNMQIIKNTYQNNLQQSKGEMVAEELIDLNKEQLDKSNIDPEEEIKGYIKGLMDALKNISTTKKNQNVRSSKNSPEQKLKMKKKDSINMLSMNKESLNNSNIFNNDNKNQQNELLQYKKDTHNQQDKIYQQQFIMKSKSMTESDEYKSLTKVKQNVQNNSSENQLSPKTKRKQQQLVKNQSPINIIHTSPTVKKNMDYQQLLQNSVSKREYNPQNYNYPLPINQEVKEKMQQSTINQLQNSLKKEQQKNQFYYDEASPSKSGKSAQKLTINDLQVEKQSSSQKKDFQQNQKIIIAQQNSIESSSNYYYFTESVPADLKQSKNTESIEDKTPQNYLIQSVDTAAIDGFNSIKKYQIQSSNTEKRSASTHRIIRKEQYSRENFTRQITSQKERSATIHHGGEEVVLMNQGITVDDVQGQYGVLRTDSKIDALLKVRRGRSVIKTINPYKSAEKLSSQLRKSTDNKNSNFKTGVNSYRCTSEPRGCIHESQQSINEANQQEGLNNKGVELKQTSQTARQYRAVSVPSYQQHLINYNQLDQQEQEAEESKSELIFKQKQLSYKFSNDSSQQDQHDSLKMQNILSFGPNHSRENSNTIKNKDNIQILRSDSQGGEKCQKKWFQQINQNSYQQQQNIFSNNHNENIQTNNSIYGNDQVSKVEINPEQKRQQIIYSSSPYLQNSSEYTHFESAVPQQQNFEQRKATELTELVELLEDEQLDEQTWKKKSARKGSAIIHFTPSKRNITYQSYKTAHCSFIDDNETVKTEFMGQINQSQLIFQDENEHEVSKITPRQLNNFKSRNSFLSSDLMSDLNLRRSNKQLQIQIKNIQLSSNQNLPSSSRQLSSRVQLPSPIKQQKNDLQQQLLSHNLDSISQPYTQYRSNSQQQYPVNNLYDNTRNSIINNFQIDSQNQYQGYDQNSQSNFQRQNSKEIYQMNQQIIDNQVNQQNIRPQSYFRKPPTHRQYKSKGGQAEDILINGITQINSQQSMNNILVNDSQKNQHKKLLSQQIIDYDILKNQQSSNIIQKQQQLQILERKQMSKDLTFENQNLKQEQDKQLNSMNFQKQNQIQNNFPVYQSNKIIRQGYNLSKNQNINFIRNQEEEDANEERILDLLLLDTHELKDKLRESSRNKYNNEIINQKNYKEIVKSLPIPPQLPPNKNIFQEYNQKIFSYENNIV